MRIVVNSAAIRGRPSSYYSIAQAFSGSARTHFPSDWVSSVVWRRYSPSPNAKSHVNPGLPMPFDLQRPLLAGSASGQASAHAAASSALWGGEMASDSGSVVTVCSGAASGTGAAFDPQEARVKAQRIIGNRIIYNLFQSRRPFGGGHPIAQADRHAKEKAALAE